MITKYRELFNTQFTGQKYQEFKDDITSDNIYAVVEAGALAGVLRKQEHELIENVFELESRTVPSSMTSRESVIYFDLRESEERFKSL